MAAKTVVWVMPEGGVESARVAAELWPPGFRIVPTAAEQALGVDADLRILPCGIFHDSETFAVEYGHDPRPTLVLVDSSEQEREVLKFVRSLDEIGRSDEPAPIIANRLARLAARYDSDEQAHERARFDELTWLPDRRIFELSLRRAVAASRTEECKALLFLDLDGFKSVNDKYGHAAGDRVLIEVANRLAKQRQAGESLARLGGDEFVFLLIRKDRESLREAAERIFRSIGARPFDVDGAIVTITASAGLAFIESGAALTAIFRNADQAAYEAKNLGKNVLVVFVKSAYRKANEDPLTGLYNHGYFDAKLLLEIKHAQEYHSPFTIALVDLDDFGKINKRIGFGLPAGDAALKRFAEVATGCVRSTDWIARCGGDEFCLVMPGTTLETGGEVAERVRAAVASSELRSPSQERFSITASIGVVQWTGLCGGPVSLVQRASDTVIEAKRRGGNCVVPAQCEGKE